MLDHHRPSVQARPVMPEDGGDTHPRCLEMAETMRDLFAVGGGVRRVDLIGAGFTQAEIAEFEAAAASMATASSTRQVTRRPDLIPDIIDKARQAMPNRPPLPRRTSETQAIVIAWGRYCAARGAFIVDPWPAQRERCLAILSAYLDLLPLFPLHKAEVLKAVDETLPQVRQ